MFLFAVTFSCRLGTLHHNPAVTTDFYYNEHWQIVEEVATAAGSDTPVVFNYVWDQRYIDTPIVV